MKMRSLALKLTLAFLLVAVAGVAIFAALLGGQTQSEFSRFLSGRDQSVLVSTLADYYAQTGSWKGVDSRINSNQQLAFYGRSAALIDIHGIVVFGSQPYAAGQQLPQKEIDESTAVHVSEQVVGYVHFGPVGHVGIDDRGVRPAPNEAAFVGRVVQAALTSAGIAALIALLIGIVLARTLTKPVRG